MSLDWYSGLAEAARRIGLTAPADIDRLDCDLRTRFRAGAMPGKHGVVVRRWVIQEAARWAVEEKSRRKSELSVRSLGVPADAQESQRVVTVTRMRTLPNLLALSGSEFEGLIAKLFRRDGYRVSEQGRSGDEGIDLVLHMGNSRDVAQCKRWRSGIGSPMVREFYGAYVHSGARHGFIITTASFSRSARAFAENKPITLVDGALLGKWLNAEVQPEGPLTVGTARAASERATANGIKKNGIASAGAREPH